MAVEGGLGLGDVLEICDQIKEDLRKELVGKTAFDT